MKYITKLDYLNYLQKHPCEMLRDNNEDYIFETAELKYNQQKLEKVDKKHDKIVKIILSQKREVAKFLNQFIEPPFHVSEKDLIQCPTEFITRQYKSKQGDIIYRLKDHPVYFLIEHQSTVEKRMIERMGSYTEEIMRKEERNDEYPIVVPL